MNEASTTVSKYLFQSHISFERINGFWLSELYYEYDPSYHPRRKLQLLKNTWICYDFLPSRKNLYW